MIILYQDPDGTGLKDMTSSSHQRSGSSDVVRAKSNADMLELKQKIVNLEKTISEQETTINKMKEEQSVRL